MKTLSALIVATAFLFVVGCNSKGTCVDDSADGMCVVNFTRTACESGEFVETAGAAGVEVCRSHGFTYAVSISGTELTPSALRSEAEEGQVVTMTRPTASAQ